MGSQMEAVHHILVAAQENVLEELELYACCCQECGDGDDDRDEHDGAWVQD